MLKLWAEEGGTRDNACCSLASVNDARRVAASIGIPFYLLDAAPSFYEKVVVPFIEAYLRGETPNPCADCNPLVRWRWLLNYANLIGAKYVATGHYARIRRDGSGIPVLSRGADRRKDQSYVLSRIPIDALNRTPKKKNSKTIASKKNNSPVPVSPSMIRRKSVRRDPIIS